MTVNVAWNGLLPGIGNSRAWDNVASIAVALQERAADLMTSPGHGPNEADALRRMQENEDAWRA